MYYVLITFDDMGSGLMWSVKWEEAGGPGENQRVLIYYMYIFHGKDLTELLIHVIPNTH